MTLTEILKQNGIADDVIEKITADMKSNSIHTASEENLDIRYKKLKDDYDGLTAQHAESTKLIEQLKAGTKGNEALQNKVSEYESQIAQLQEDLKHTQMESAIKVALLAEKATDVDYMAFKLKEKGELELDESGKIKGIDDKIAGLKTQFPAQFETSKAGNQIDANPLPTNDNNHSYTKAEILKKPYAERQKIFAENPEAYNAAMRSE